MKITKRAPLPEKSTKKCEFCKRKAKFYVEITDRGEVFNFYLCPSRYKDTLKTYGIKE